MLDKKELFSKDYSKRVTVHVPNWGIDITVKSMSIAEAFEYDKIKDSEDLKQRVIWLVMLCCVNEDGSRVFDEQDIPEIEKLDSESLLVVFDAAFTLNFLDKNKLDDKAKNL